MKRSIISFVVVLVLVSAMLLSCTAAPAATSSSPASAAASQAATAAPSASASVSASANPNAGKTLTIMASQDWVRDGETAISQQFTKDTGIKVDWQISPADQYPNLLTTKLNAGQCADIFMNQSGKFDIVSQMQIAKNGVDLSGEEWASRLTPAVKDQLSVDGKLYGITFWDVGDSYAYTYNKQIFAKYNLKVPTTFAEFMTVCETLKKNGITPMYEANAEGWHIQLNFFDVSAMYNKADTTMIDKLNNNQTTFAQNPVFKTFLTQMKQVVDAGYWGDNWVSNKYTDTGAAMASGKYAMTCNMMGRVSLITDASKGALKDSDFGFFPAPYLDNQTIAETPCGPSMFVFSGSKNIDIAKQFLAYMAKQENLQALIDNKADQMNSLPFTGLKNTYSADVQDAMTKYKTGDATVYQNIVKYVNPQWMDLGKDIASYLLGKSTADDVIKHIDTRRADQAKTASDSNWKK
ncbi:MAG: ABC transporter substrate-binding protein [Eubacteriales bacterium]